MTDLTQSTQQAAEPPYPTLTREQLKSPHRRRVWLPVFLFAATCVATFWSGAKHWMLFVPPIDQIDRLTTVRWTVLNHWETGLTYMVAVLAILFAHEMGHFVATLIYRIPASLPFFIPFPFSPIGTMGAVIGMAGHKADRRQIFDIGIAGPLAGLVVAIPVLMIGIKQLDPTAPAHGQLAFDLPWIMGFMFQRMNPGAVPPELLYVNQMNAYLMAAWVGLLITGLNMLPVSQLDGGHIIYALFRKKGHWIARGFLIFSILFVVATGAMIWGLMIILVTMMGVDHPPTANDEVPLGWFRTGLGLASLAIPFLCFPSQGVIV
jgi:membrane-associated protease RseP (regulator of RpoE activity)